MANPLSSIQTAYAHANTNYPLFARLIRFVVSGGTATTVNLIILFSLTHFFHIWYILSSVIAFCAAFVISFVLQKVWTFEDTSMEKTHVQAALFFLIITAGLGVNTVLVFCLVEYVGLHYLAAQLVSGVFIAVVNYFSYKHLVFRGAGAQKNLLVSEV